MATTRQDIQDTLNAGDYNRPVTNDTELDIEVGKIAEQQKRETGQSDDSALIKSRILAGGFSRDVKEPKTMEEDMKLGHADSVTAKQQDTQNQLQAAKAQTAQLEAQAAAETEKKTSKK